MRTISLAALLGAACAASAQARQQQEPARDFGALQAPVDPKKVDDAIKKGLQFLRGCEHSPGHEGNVNCDELLALACLHGGMTSDDPHLKNLLARILSARLERTYKVSLQAVLLEEMSRVWYQSRIAQCAQFLVDNQCSNGQWGYGEPSTFADAVPTGPPPPKEVASAVRNSGDDAPAPGEKKKPKVLRRIAIKKQREGPASGDNSNSQYAALGLRSCSDAGIQIPEEVLNSAERWWRSSLMSEEAQAGSAPVATGPAPSAAPVGWSYNLTERPWGSMTAGAVGSLSICLYLENKPWKSDKDVLGGLEWLSKNWAITSNPKIPRTDEQFSAHYYYLYALERAGILAGTARVGSHDWYQEGARYLLAQQKHNGSWVSASDWHPEWATSFAILFLKRATRPLPEVASQDRYFQK